MLKFIFKRLLSAVPTFIGVTALVFFLSNCAPGSPADVIAAASGLSGEAYENLKISLGLDKPVIVRYLIWLGNLLHGDFGVSTSTSQEVLVMLNQRIAPSLILALAAMIISLVISIPLGLISGYKPYSFWDEFSSLFAFAGSSIPNFFLSLIAIYILAVKLKLLPAQGMYSVGKTGDIGSLILHLILPASVLAIQLIGSFIKQIRGSIMEVLNEEYIKTARSKGISEIRVVIKHAFRNALIPITTTVGLSVPFLIGGALVTEQIFSWPGVGSLLVQAIDSRDYNVIMGVTVLISAIVLVTNLVLDILYGLLDPKISYS